MSETQTPPRPAARQSKGRSMLRSIYKVFPRRNQQSTTAAPTSSSIPTMTELEAPQPLSNSQNSQFDKRFPHGYKIADSTIPLFPNEVPNGHESLFSPNYVPICQRLFWWGFLCPLLWAVGMYLFLHRRVQLNATIDPKMYWTRVQWLKLNTKYGASCSMAILIVLLLIIIIVMVVKTYGG